MSKIKFDIKIEFCKIQGINYLIAKKIKDSNEFLIKVFNLTLMISFFSLHYPFL